MIHALLIDDDILSGPILKAALKKSFDLIVETSGANAVARAIEVAPQLILLDINMPNVDGYEVLRQFKNHPLLSAIPVICISGDTGQDSRSRAFGLGAAGFVLKPIAVRTIASDLNSILGSINVSMKKDERSFLIAFNQGEKYRLMKNQIREALQTGQPVAILSLENGFDFCDEKMKEDIVTGAVTYLQIKPSLIAKVSYLTDFAPVIADIRGFFEGSLKNTHLFFDDPHLVINFKETKNAIARLHTLKNELCPTFKSVSFFSAKETAPEAAATLNEMASIFCR